VVIAEIKKPTVKIGSEQKSQTWKYVSELIERGYITEATTTTCYILGSEVNQTDRGHRTEWDSKVTIIPMTYNTFVKRAEKRMLGLRQKLSDVPFLKEQGLDARAFIEPQGQIELQLQVGE
jgi:hypothetical protein